MPSKSEKQKRLMAAVANNPKFAKQVGIPQSVGKEFEREDKKMANCGTKRNMAMGGKVGMHKMPDGTMMPGKKHGMRAGGKLNMVKKGDKMVPDFAADGVGKMKAGGAVYRKGGKVRGAGMAKKGVRPCKIC
jgi:hypothetical protein